MIITPQKMCAEVLKILEDVTKDIPADRRGEAQANILNAFGGMMFKGSATKEKK